MLHHNCVRSLRVAKQRASAESGFRGRDRRRFGGAGGSGGLKAAVEAAGGGIKGGIVYGASDAAFKAVENPVHIYDLHATILSFG